MRAESITHTFSARLERLGAAGGSHLVVVPEDVAAELLRGERRGRAIVTLGGVSWHAGVNPYGGGRHYVQVGANYFGPLGYALGDTLTLKLRRDDSPYGMEPCVEFVAVAEADRYAARHMVADEGYDGRQLRLDLYAQFEAVLKAVMRRNCTDREPYEPYLARFRRYVDTVSSQLCDEVTARVNRAKRFSGLNARIARKLLARTVKQ